MASLKFTTTMFVMMIIYATTAADTTTNFVFKGCADQNFPNPSDTYIQNLQSLFSTLVSDSSQKTFATATSGDGQNAITGLFQCRGDLSVAQCYSCVSKMPDMSDKLCGKAVAVRVQLNGCYLSYEIIGFKQVSETQALYKNCGSIKASGAGFEEKRDTAFDMVKNGLKSSNNGSFYAGTYQQVYVLGQCEGDLASDDCGDCVEAAFQTTKTECADSISGQVYLHKCYISFSYYPNGVPNPSSPGKIKRFVLIIYSKVQSFVTFSMFLSVS